MILDAKIRHPIVPHDPLPAGEDLFPCSIQHAGSIYFILQQRIDGVKGLGLPPVLFVGLVPEPEHGEPHGIGTVDVFPDKLSLYTDWSVSSSMCCLPNRLSTALLIIFKAWTSRPTFVGFFRIAFGSIVMLLDFSKL